MIICSNCGTTNNESAGNICRNCGALLPRSRRPPRMKIDTKNKEIIASQEQRIQQKKKPQAAVPQKKSSKKKTKSKPSGLDLHEIPKIKALNNDSVENFEDTSDLEEEDEEIEDDFDELLDDMEEDTEILKEITPQPFRGSIIVDKNVYGPPKRSSKISGSSSKGVSQNAVASETTESNLLKQKQLEDEMTKVLSFLSKKITVKPLKPVKERVKASTISKESIPPSSMNEILKDLLKLDLHIEASAIIKKDGTILASALSSRISDSLFATIAANLSMIGNDIIEGLNAGTLQNISIRGTEGVLDLAPISFKNLQGEDMILIIFSHPKIKSGIIHFAVSIVKKRVQQYLGLSK